MNAVFPHAVLRVFRVGIFLLLFLFFFSTARATPLQLGERSSYELAGHMELLKDPSLKMDFSEVLKAGEKGRFRHLDANLNNGYKQEACWVRLTIERNSSFPEHSLLRLKPNYINYLTLYIQIPGKDPKLASSYRIVRLGNHIPAPERPVLHPDFVVPLVIPASEPVIIYARVFSNSSISLAGVVHTATDLRDYSNLHIIIQSSVLGIFLTILLINVIFYISTRDRIFFSYSTYLLAGIIVNFAVEGVMTLLFPSIVHLVSDYLVYGGIGLNILVYSEFSRILFSKAAGRWSMHYMRLLSLLGLVTIIAVPLGFYPIMAPLGFIGFLTLVAIQLVLSYRLRVYFPGSEIYIVLAFTVNALGYFHMLLRLIGVIPLGFLWDMNTLQFTSLFHITLISIALSRRVLMAERVLTERAEQALNTAKATEQKALALARDMTQELRKSNTKLEVALASEQHALQQQHRFLSMLSHEYRTPLAVIRGNLDIIEIQNPGQQCRYDEELSAMHHAVDRLVEVMEVSLERSRHSEPSINSELQRISLVPYLSFLVATMQSMWPLCTFSYNETPDSHTILGDSKTLKTAIFNLLDNARKYSLPDSPVEVETHEEEGVAVITIRNQGEMFSNEDGEEFFNKYSRGDHSKSTSGAGLGLWLVRNIIEQHNGHVTLKATASSICATVRLPQAI
jgi:signal transduction histidine kinase